MERVYMIGQLFEEMTARYPYWAGFVKFAILASTGDLLAGRIIYGQWKRPKGLIGKALIWGILGVMITLVFTVYYNGVHQAQLIGRLPFAESRFALALFASIVMNLTFGPMLYIYHKFGDLIVEFTIDKQNKSREKIFDIDAMIKGIDWNSMVKFSWLKTCTLVWIPCHTFVFMLPANYRVLASALLSILLGVIIGLTRKHSHS
jgi:hypothetical protein